MGHDHLAWKETSRTVVQRCRIFDMTVRSMRSASGIEGDFTVLEAPDWAACVPLTERGGIPHFLMVRQWRHGSGKLSLEFPGGVVDAGESPLEAAERELLEETGYRALEIIPLGSVNPNPAFMTNRFHVFLSRGIEAAGAQSLDRDEVLDFCFVPVHEVMDALGADGDAHALMVLALAKYLAFESRLTV